MKYVQSIVVFLSCFFLQTTFGQESNKKIFITAAEYNKLKIEGKLNETATYMIDLKKEPALQHPRISQVPQQTFDLRALSSVCAPFSDCDTSFSLIPGISVPNDDFPGTELILPFSICFYGTNYTSIYINNNGNITFGAGFGVYTPVGFPNSQAIMIAPFWADVDTRTAVSDLPCMQLTNSHVIAIWGHVDYFNASGATHQVLFDTFKCIITDGSDPILPANSNVGFFYGNMDWTTGDASGGVNGFGGSAATVGANAGNGVDFIQFGRFDQPGTAYDGPFGANDGVDFLDGRTFVFSTCPTTTGFNIPPIFTASGICDTLHVCLGDIVNLNYSFIPGEPTQVDTPKFNNNGIPNFTVLSQITGANGVLNLQFAPDSVNIGINVITVSATDNGTPPATSTFNIVISVDTFNLVKPLITGQNFYCPGAPGVILQVPTIYSSYLWNDSTVGVTTRQVTAGTYNVEVTDGHGCKAKSPAFPVWVDILNPIIGGVTALCGQDSAHLITTQPFLHYQWNVNGTAISGDTASYLNVGASDTFSVSVTDINNCSFTSSSLFVGIHHNPNASFIYSPVTGLAGDTIHFTNTSVADIGTTIVGTSWNFGDGANSNSNATNPDHVYDVVGNYNVLLQVTQSDGCIDTYSIAYIVESDSIEAPNIFTPNLDGKNDLFTFKNLEFYPNSKLEIFSRWGRRVYENASYDNKWNGGDLSEGVYYYILKIPEKDVMKGTVTIKR